jgi:hypothetical protein
VKKMILNDNVCFVPRVLGQCVDRGFSIKRKENKTYKRKGVA